MLAAPVGVGFKLALEIAKLEIGKARAPCTIAASFETMATEAGIGGARARSAKGDQFARSTEALGRRVLDGCAGLKSARQHERTGQPDQSPWKAHQAGGTDSIRRRFRSGTHAVRLMGNSLPRATEFIPVLVLLTSACKPPPDERQFMPIANAARGKAAIERVGCASCHDIAGIRWPKGSVGPTIETMRDRALIAGRVPNEPEMLARFVRNAPALVPGTTMPSMPLTEQDSRDVAAYLYEIGG
jgi:cytochrome c2